jgi:ubiquinone/menaquinone biosynthesis C-methylase UbiE
MSIEMQQSFWNRWHSANPNPGIGAKHRRQAEIVRTWLSRLGRADLRIIEVGCGSAWFTPALREFGSVTATDLADEPLAHARARMPDVEFITGDFMTIDFGSAPFDAAILLEVLGNVADQAGFVAKLARLVRPGGHLMLAIQNRPVLQKYNSVRPPEPGQVRHWTSAAELRDLLRGDFDVLRLYSVTVRADHGFLHRVTTGKASVPMKLVFGSRAERVWEWLGFGWTLMALARRRPAAS